MDAPAVRQPPAAVDLDHRADERRHDPASTSTTVRSVRRHGDRLLDGLVRAAHQRHPRVAALSAGIGHDDLPTVSASPPGGTPGQNQLLVSAPPATAAGIQGARNGRERRAKASPCTRPRDDAPQAATVTARIGSRRRITARPLGPWPSAPSAAARPPRRRRRRATPVTCAVRRPRPARHRGRSASHRRTRRWREPRRDREPAGRQHESAHSTASRSSQTSPRAASRSPASPARCADVICGRDPEPESSRDVLASDAQPPGLVERRTEVQHRPRPTDVGGCRFGPDEDRSRPARVHGDQLVDRVDQRPPRRVVPRAGRSSGSRPGSRSGRTPRGVIERTRSSCHPATRAARRGPGVGRRPSTPPRPRAAPR